MKKDNGEPVFSIAIEFFFLYVNYTRVSLSVKIQTKLVYMEEKKLDS